MSFYKGTSLVSAGIDIGTTTTHLTISRLEIANVASAYRVPRLSIASREILYQSAVYFTPLLDEGVIDGAGVARIVALEYERAGIQPSQVTTGAAIITGETALLRNAPEVVQELARFAGDFVVASAGVHLESILAGKGSGAAQSSAERHKTICNVDIGGGTTNIAVFSMGKLLDTACVGIGGRCIVFDDAGAVLRITDSGLTFFDAVAKLQYIKKGSCLSPEQMELFGSLLAEALVRTFLQGDPPQVSERLFVTEMLRHDYAIDEYWLSGGVAELINGNGAPLAFNDMGGYLAAGLRDALNQYGVNWHIPDMPVRATVLGAGMHSMQLSGSTITVKPETLPLRNLPVVKISQVRHCENIGEFLMRQIETDLAHHEMDWHSSPVVLSLEALPSLSFESLKGWAEVFCALHSRCKLATPLVILTAQDIAMALGQLIKQHQPALECVVLDGIITEHGDFVDIGQPLAGASTVPVVVKTLVFHH